VEPGTLHTQEVLTLSDVREGESMRLVSNTNSRSRTVCWK